MFDSVEELLAKIRLGEDATLELKRVITRGARVLAPERDDLADELAAIANTADGVLLLGIDDGTKDVLGIPLIALDDAERLAREVCNDSIKPPIVARITRIELPDEAGVAQPLIKIDVPRSLFVHKSPRGYFHRIGSSKREMPTDYLLRLGQQRSQARLIRFDEQAVPDTTRADLDPDLWHRFSDPATESTLHTLRKRKLLTEQDGVERATVAGILLCSAHPERWLSSATARAVRFRGVHQDSNFQVDATDVVGPVDQQILSLYAFARRVRRSSVRRGPPPAEVPQFSDRALFEAIVNAVVHRDYSVFGSRIRLFIFDDRLELYSPGPLPNTLSVDSIALRQSTRNEAIKSVLAKLPVAEAGGGSGRGFYMEANGDGVPTIIRETQMLAGRSPEWRVIDDSEVLLTIPGAPDEGD